MHSHMAVKKGVGLYFHFSLRLHGVLLGHIIFTYISVNVPEVEPNYSSACSQHHN